MILIEEWYVVRCQECHREVDRAGLPEGAEMIADAHNAAEHPESWLAVAYE